MLHPGAFVLSLALPSLLHFHPAAQPDQRSDEEAIRSIVDHLIAAWNRHDAHAFAALFSPDADFTDGRGTAVSGREHIQAFHAQPFATVFQQSRLEQTGIRTRFLRADVASVDVPWQMTGMAGPDGKPHPARKGLISLVMLRDAEHWEIAVMHNLDLSALPPAVR
jgi:uncharacterized protein (TIGR02246 family)